MGFTAGKFCDLFLSKNSIYIQKCEFSPEETLQIYFFFFLLDIAVFLDLFCYTESVAEH